LPNVTIRIVPLDTAHRGTADSFIILQFGDDVVSIEHLSNEIYVEDETDTDQYKLAFDHHAEESPPPPENQELIVHRHAGPGADDFKRGETMGWLDRLITEMTQICREALGSWNRTGQLCALIFTIALGLALLLWVTHR
jgi:hypothetical protein